MIMRGTPSAFKSDLAKNTMTATSASATPTVMRSSP